ncbi:peptidyl-prolyl cis-trans isomerase D [Tangfeifania diversioriginum]|uniref:Periplasmic chaperone PpiD n=1 Tax=Tangfeifania diversioriginum TaxID=1168035 RepID=A0A1M6MUU3_9BACT|nr:peptidylprolyl isomerase [Tangfeifania diversioriginum]SHJ87170.1 peptidyl-prolyl cis-trans isomerase D [Tangfeifania diversioriginum]
MATLQTIRTRAGLLVAIVIGISLAAFILGDMFQGGSSLFQGDRLEIGEVEGQSIQYPEFQQQVEELGEIYRMNTQESQLDESTWVQVREQAWQNNVRRIIMDDVYENLGVAVSSEELFDMLQGTNLHPIVQQLFQNPNTGQVDRSAVIRFLQNLESGAVAPEQREYWLYLEDQIVEQRIQTKYNNLVGKGLFVTTEEAQNSLEAKNKQVSFDYIALSRNTVADSQVVVAEKDLKDYYNANQENYRQEKNRNIEYITFPVTPSDADYEDAQQWVTDAVSDFASAEDNVAFVNSNSDVSFDNTWYKQNELPADIATWIFEGDAEVGDIFGPYFEDEAYKLAKLHASEMMPDSVEARHILLQVNTQEELLSQQELADSLKTAIENGSDFGELAQEYSADQGSAIQGGELGWFGRGQMVEPFEEAAFNNDINEVTVVPSQFGIHVIQTTGRGDLSRQVQVAYLVRNVVPSTQTYQNVYARASEFAGEVTNKVEFDAAVEENDLNKRAASVRENDRNIAGLENARPLVRAAYESKEGKLLQDTQGSTIFDLGDNFVIATLASATEEGIADFESVRDRVELAVMREKKAEFLKEKASAAMEGKTDLAAIASELDATVESASNINFNSVQIPGVGMEPAVIGTATTLDADQISKPVTGNSGVYIVQVTSVTEGTNQDVESEQMQLAQNLTFRAQSEAYNAHREIAEIEDQRAKFY